MTMPDTENLSDEQLDALTRPAGVSSSAAAEAAVSDDPPPPPPRDGGTYLYDPIARTYTLVDGTRPKDAPPPPARVFDKTAGAYLVPQDKE